MHPIKDSPIGCIVFISGKACSSSQAPRKHFSQVTALLAEKLVASSQAPRPSLFRKYLLAEKLVPRRKLLGNTFHK